MKILVCGGREFDNWGITQSTLDDIASKNEKFITIIEGGAKGADFLSRVWAIYRNFDYKEYPANWKAHGKGAGPIRNQQMLDEGKPDLVVAFPGDSGTADMVWRAKKAGVKVIEVAK